jgi:PTS system mannose-specific IIA component
MIGVIVATHGEFGLVLLSTLRMIMGETEGIVAIDLVSQDSMESFQSKMEKALETVDPKGSGALVLVDMLGGTPFNVALRLSQTRKLQVVTGVNLPMLIKVASDRDGTQLERLAQDVQAATRESIVTSLELLKKQG